MTVSRAQIEHLKDVLRRERQWRDRVFRGRQHAAKVGEIDEALTTVHAIEGTLKEASLLKEPFVQGTLLPLEMSESGGNGNADDEELGAL